MAAMVVNVLWQVLTRFILATPSSYTEELARYITERGQPKARGPLDDALKESQRLTAMFIAA